MSEPTPTASPVTVSAGGALLALAGLLVLVALSTGVATAPLFLFASVLLAVGGVVLAFGLRGEPSVAGRSVAGRVALVVSGFGGLLFQALGAVPVAAFSVAAIVVGTTALTVITAATVIGAVVVARAGVVRGPARWVLLLVAADALLTFAVSSIPVEGFAYTYAAWDLTMIRPVVLLIAGVAFVLHGGAAHLRALNETWRRTTDVGGAPPHDDASTGASPARGA